MLHYIFFLILLVLHDWQIQEYLYNQSIHDSARHEALKAQQGTKINKKLVKYIEINKEILDIIERAQNHENISKEEFTSIKETANNIRNIADYIFSNCTRIYNINITNFF